MRSIVGLVVALLIGCGGVTAVTPDAGDQTGAAGAGDGRAGAGMDATGAAGTSSSSAGTTGAGGALAAGGSGGSDAGAAGASAGTQGAAGTSGGTGAAGSTGGAGVSGAAGATAPKCIHINGPLIVAAICPGKKTCSSSCSCSAGYGSSNQSCGTGNEKIGAQLPCAAAAEYVGDQPGAGKAQYPPDGLLEGFCNGSGSLCYRAATITCVSDCAVCP